MAVEVNSLVARRARTSVRAGSGTDEIGARKSPEPRNFLELLRVEASELCVATLTSVDPVEAVVDTVARTAEVLAISPWRAAAELLDRVLCEPCLGDVTTERALHAQITAIAGATLAKDASLWARGSGRKLELLASSAEASTVLGARPYATRAIEEDDAVTTGVRRLVHAVPVHLVGLRHAALVLRGVDVSTFANVEEIACRAAVRLAPVLERRQLLERGEAREKLLVEAGERRLARLAYDLHDGPLQGVAALAEELRLLCADVQPLVTEASRPAVGEAFRSVEDHLRHLEATVRTTAQSLETSAVRREPLGELLNREAVALERGTGIQVRVSIDDGIGRLTDSQAIALYRAAQEALSNVREHSGATRVEIGVTNLRGATNLTILDNGRGFDPATRLSVAARQGRLGLVGIAERVRLLGGALDVSSTPGSGTTLKLALAHWAPLPAA